MRIRGLLIFLFFLSALAPVCPAYAEEELDEELLKAEAEASKAPTPQAPVEQSMAPVEEAPVSEVNPPASDETGLQELEEQMRSDTKTTDPRATEQKKVDEAEVEELTELGKELEKDTDKLPPALQSNPAPLPTPAPAPSPGVSNTIVVEPPKEADPDRTVVCCKTTRKYPSRYGSEVVYDLKRKRDCADDSRTHQEIETPAHSCREEMKCCELPNLGHVYSVDCLPEQVIENTQKCEERRMKKRMRICCVTVQDDGWIAIEGWIQRKRCHEREGQLMSLPQELCLELRTEDRPQ